MAVLLALSPAQEGAHQANYGAAWRLRIEPRFGSTPVRRIKPGHVDDWIADMLEQGTSASKVIESAGVLKRVLDLAVRDRAIAANPCALRTATLPEAAEDRAAGSVSGRGGEAGLGHAHEQERVLVRLLAYCGLRIGEALALERNDVDLQRKTHHDPPQRRGRDGQDHCRADQDLRDTRRSRCLTRWSRNSVASSTTGSCSRTAMVSTAGIAIGAETCGTRPAMHQASSRCRTTFERPVRAC